MAITLLGNWKSGKAFDLHTVSSSHLGMDQYGHDRFDNTRSEMGQLVYELKYHFSREAIPRIVEMLDGIGGIEGFDCLVPIPTTKKNRPVKAVELIAEALGKRRRVKVFSELLLNGGDEELKGTSDPIERNDRLRSALSLSGIPDVSGLKILLIDDLYRSGSTLSVATDLLYSQGKASSVSVLTMTKTRSNR